MTKRSRSHLFGAWVAFTGASVAAAADIPKTLPPATGPGVESPPALLAPPGPNGPVSTVAADPTVRVLPDPAPGFYNPQFWANAEYVLFRIKDGGNPQPLITSNTSGDLPSLGTPGTQVLFGHGDLNYGSFNGTRADAGWWFSRDGRWGIGASGFMLERRSTNFQATSTTPLDFSAVNANTPGAILGRPYIDANTGTEEAEVVTIPGVLNGTVYASTSSRLWGAESNLYRNVVALGATRFDVYTGFRYLDLRETLTVGEVTFLDDAQTLGSGVIDSFATRNQFYGGTLGARGSYAWGKATVLMSGSVALGSNNQSLAISGATNSFNGPDVNAVAAGLMASASNQGRYSQTKFAVVPETNIKVGYQVTDRLNAFVGYNALWLTSAARPGDQVDRTINPNNAPILSGNTTLTATSPMRPSADLNTASFYAHGVSFGMSLQY